jgi:hypothetical protein
MQFSRSGNFWRAVRITGPTHNLLGLAFSNEAVAAPRAQNIDKEKDKPARLKAEDVVAHVLSGVAEANAKWHLHVNVSEIEYIGSDTPPADVYRFLAFELIRHFRDHQDPKEVEPRSASS